MSQRSSIYKFYQVPVAEKTRTPNYQVNVVSGEVRIFYPHTATPAEIRAVLDSIYRRAVEEVEGIERDARHVDGQGQLT